MKHLVLAALLMGSGVAVADELEFGDSPFEITGKIQKPQIVVVLARENLKKGFEIQLRETFLRRIVDATREPPF